jgi:DNA-binding CsgD family transcriptional regulator
MHVLRRHVFSICERIVPPVFAEIPHIGDVDDAQVMHVNDDSASIERIIAGLYEGILDEGEWRAALTAIARIVGGQGPYLMSLVPSTGEVLRDEMGDYDSRVVARFRKHWALKDIRVQAGLSMPVDEPVTEATILTRGEWEKSEIFNEFLYPNDMAWFLATWIHKSPSRFTCLSVQATHDRGPFAMEDVALLRRVTPHVRRALNMKDRLRLSELRADSLSHMLERAPFGVVVLDDRGHVLEISPQAVFALESTSALRRTAGGGFTFVGPIGRQLRELMTSRMHRGGSIDGFVHAQRPDGRPPLRLVLAPIPVRAAPWLSPSPRWSVFVFDPERRMHALIGILMQDLAVTYREAELAALLASGADVTSAATRLRIKEQTARAHLKSIFSKTGLHSQVELARRVFLSPAWRTL